MSEKAWKTAVSVRIQKQIKSATQSVGAKGSGRGQRERRGPRGAVNVLYVLWGLVWHGTAQVHTHEENPPAGAAAMHPRHPLAVAST